jgi:hypothetical protein
MHSISVLCVFHERDELENLFTTSLRIKVDNLGLHHKKGKYQNHKLTHER